MSSPTRVDKLVLLLELVVGAVGAVTVFLAVVHPWFMTWGASSAELTMTLPGDGVVVRSAQQATRAIDIDAPARDVWPWIAQLGRDRGGFYSYEVLEDLVGARIDNVDTILPGRQEWRAGDALWMYPEDKLGGAGQAPMVVHEPGRALVFATRQFGTPMTAKADGSWAFVLEPLGTERSRLVVRSRAAGYQAFWAVLLNQLVFDPMHFAMERRMMLGIKQRAEGVQVSRVYDDAAVLMWFGAFLAVLVSLVLFVRRMGNASSIAAVGAALVIFQVLTLVQPHVIVGASLLGGTIALLWRSRRPQLQSG